MKLRKVTLRSEAPQIMFILLVASEIKMAATAKRAIRGQKYLTWLTYSMVGLIDISFKKIGDFEFRQGFVTQGDSLLRHKHKKKQVAWN